MIFSSYDVHMMYNYQVIHNPYVHHSKTSTFHITVSPIVILSSALCKLQCLVNFVVLLPPPRKYCNHLFGLVLFTLVLSVNSSSPLFVNFSTDVQNRLIGEGQSSRSYRSLVTRWEAPVGLEPLPVCGWPTFPSVL